jgi:hypothetical protein
MSAHTCYSTNFQALGVKIASKTADALRRGRELRHRSRQTKPASESREPEACH